MADLLQHVRDSGFGFPERLITAVRGTGVKIASRVGDIIALGYW